jgi:hypothetical protein
MAAGHLEWLCGMVVFLSRMVHAWMENHFLDSPSRHTIQAILVATRCGCFSFGGISWFGLHVTMSFSRHPSQQTILLVSTNKELFAGRVIHPKYTTHRLGRSPSTTKNRVLATRENG